MFDRLLKNTIIQSTIDDIVYIIASIIRCLPYHVNNHISEIVNYVFQNGSVNIFKYLYLNVPYFGTLVHNKIRPNSLFSFIRNNIDMMGKTELEINPPKLKVLPILTSDNKEYNRKMIPSIIYIIKNKYQIDIAAYMTFDTIAFVYKTMSFDSYFFLF